MNYIKGSYAKEIYSNKDNGYIVGVLKLKIPIYQLKKQVFILQEVFTI